MESETNKLDAMENESMDSVGLECKERDGA
jgi:hypothetical protein